MGSPKEGTMSDDNNGEPGVMTLSLVNVMEEVLEKHGCILSDLDLASRKSEEASLRRYDAAGWLRKKVGVVAGRDLAAEPSEEEFRIGLRSGIILCSVFNKVQPGAIPKIVEGPCDAAAVQDGAALCAYQYFENVRNFLVAVEELGLPTFDASDLEQGGNSSRVVNCVLALKSYSDWKLGGGHGLWRYGSGNLKSTSSGKVFIRKNCDAFMNSVHSSNDKSSHGLYSEEYLAGHDICRMSTTGSLNALVHALISDKKQEEIPMIVESMLQKVMEEFEHRIASQKVLITPSKDTDVHCNNNSMSASPNQTMAEDETEQQKSDFPGNTRDEELSDEKMEDQTEVQGFDHQMSAHVEGLSEEKTEDNEKGLSEEKVAKQLELVERQKKDMQELKHRLHTTKAGMLFLQTKYQEDLNILGKHLRGLAHAASGYTRVLEENRKLYNQVQDLKGNIRVYCRVRPFLGGESNRLSVVGKIEAGNISIITPLKYGKEGKKSFRFNQVFDPSATQEEVFRDMQPLVRSVLDGYNVCIFAYGQTGSGKTYTMTGPKELTEEGLGVNFRALADLFLLSEQRRDIFCYDVSVQMMEIYNEQVRDLLVSDGLNKRLEIRNSSQNGINVPDANLLPVSSMHDVITLMNLGHKNRAVSSTALNDRSSRSHSCLTVHVQGRDLTSGATLRGCMHLVDLAGSERVDKSEVTGDRLKEAQHINKSLAALGDVISSLSNKSSHVPYRNSKLTQLLQDSLGGQAKTLMFVHISPDLDAVGETISTLKFAERVSTVELGAARVNKDSSDVKELKEQIANLRAALARKDGETCYPQNSLSSSPDRYTSKSGGSSPYLSRQSSEDTIALRQPMEDVDDVQVLNNPELKPEKEGFHLQEMLMNSPPRQAVPSPGLSFQKYDEKETGSGNWVDKMVMVNRQEGLKRIESTLGCKEEVNGLLPSMFYQRYTPDPSSKIYPEQVSNNFLANKKDSRSETGSVADSDDLDTATSISSEPDLVCQFTSPKVPGIPNGLGSKGKKSNLKQAKSAEQPRSLIPSLIPSPSRKLTNGASPPVHKSARHVVSADGKRKNGTSK